ncbi:MAG: hypothetical protein EOO88_55735, partial [Pedobacter sp.]
MANTCFAYKPSSLAQPVIPLESSHRNTQMKKSLHIAFIILAGIGLASCLKDKAYTNYTGVQPVIVIPNSNWPAPIASVTDSIFNTAQASAELQLSARVSFDKPVTEDLKIVFQKADDLVTAYN